MGFTGGRVVENCDAPRINDDYADHQPSAGDLAWGALAEFNAALTVAQKDRRKQQRRQHQTQLRNLGHRITPYGRRSSDQGPER